MSIYHYLPPVSCQLSCWCLSVVLLVSIYHQSVVLLVSIYHQLVVLLVSIYHHSVVLLVSIYHPSVVLLVSIYHHSVVLLVSIYHQSVVLLVCVSICGLLVTSYRSDAGCGRARHCGAQVDQYNEAHARLEVEARVHMGGACFQCATGDREERESNCTLLSSLALLFLPLSRQLRYTPRTRSSTPAFPLPFPGHPAPYLTITPTSQPPLFVHLACFRQGAGSECVHVTGFFLTGL